MNRVGAIRKAQFIDAVLDERGPEDLKYVTGGFFAQPVRLGVPTLCPSFFGAHSEGNTRLNLKMVGAQGIEPWSSPCEGSAPRPLAGHFDAEFAGFARGPGGSALSLPSFPTIPRTLGLRHLPLMRQHRSADAPLLV
jgi:hypothetical protein